MIKAAFFAALAALCLDSAKAETRYLLPDSYELDAQGIGRGVTIKKTPTGYTATVSFAPSYRLAQNYIISESGEDDLPDVVELPLEVNGFDYLLKDSFGPTAIRSIAYQYFGQKFRMILDLTDDFSQDQISKILTFSTFYGSTSARVICSPGTVHDLCDRKLPSLPTFNQFKIESDPVEQQKFQDFTSMFEYRYQIAAKNNAVELSPAELDRLFRADMLEGIACRSSLATVRLGICSAVQRLSPVSLSLYDSMKRLGGELYKKEVGEEELSKIAPILTINEGHKGEVVTFEMRDHNFAWPGTVWSQIMPTEYPNFWSMDWVDDSTPSTDIVFSNDFYLSKFDGGFYFSDRINEYGFATGGFSAWTSPISGEAFRISGISRGSLISGRIFTRFSMRDEKNIPKAYLEIMQRLPGESAWTSVKIFRQPTTMVNKVLDAGVFYTIENIFVPEGREVMMRYIVPPDVAWDQRGQFLTLYLAEMRGVKCSAEIWKKVKQFCK